MVTTHLNMQAFISVIIPVYNAVRYVALAVASAHDLPAVGEIVLVDDGHPDGGYAECLRLQTIYPKVRVLQHEGGANKGAGPSRNLGIEHARCEWIAFLDADDLYLPNRFDAEAKLCTQPGVEGVYNCAAYLIDSDYAKNRVEKRYKIKDAAAYKYTVRDPQIPREELFYYLLNGGKGHFHTSAITVKKNVFDRVGLFAPLKLHQDSHMWVRLALEAHLLPGNLAEPTALIRVHEDNRIRHVNRSSTSAYYEQLYLDLHTRVKRPKDYATLVKKKLAAQGRVHKNKWKNLPQYLRYALQHFSSHPADLLKISWPHLLK